MGMDSSTSTGLMLNALISPETDRLESARKVRCDITVLTRMLCSTVDLTSMGLYTMKHVISTHYNCKPTYRQHFHQMPRSGFPIMSNSEQSRHEDKPKPSITYHEQRVGCLSSATRRL